MKQQYHTMVFMITILLNFESSKQISLPPIWKWPQFWFDSMTNQNSNLLRKLKVRSHVINQHMNKNKTLSDSNAADCRCWRYGRIYARNVCCNCCCLYWFRPWSAHKLHCNILKMLNKLSLINDNIIFVMRPFFYISLQLSKASRSNCCK